LQRFLVVVPDRFGLGDAEAIPHRPLIVRHLSQDLAFGISELHAVVITFHDDAAVVIFHTGEQRCEPLRRVGYIIPVVTAVEIYLRAIDRKPRLGVATVAEHDRRRAAFMHWPVIDHDSVSAEGALVRLGHGGHIRRVLFLLAVKQHLHVHGRFKTRRLESVKSGEKHHDRPLVVGRRTREKPPVRVDFLALELTAINLFPLASRIACLERRYPRALLRPLLRQHRLPVEMHVEKDRFRPPRCRVYSANTSGFPLFASCLVANPRLRKAASSQSAFLRMSSALMESLGSASMSKNSWKFARHEFWISASVTATSCVSAAEHVNAKLTQETRATRRIRIFMEISPVAFARIDVKAVVLPAVLS
jgi:hypothetical protein